MLRSYQILALLTLLVLAGCRPKPERVGEVVMDEGTVPLSFESVGSGASARLPGPFVETVLAPAAWDTLQPRLAFTRPPKPVDFTGAMVIVVAPEVPSSGHSVRVESIEEDGDSLHVAYTLYTPAADCITEGRPQKPFQVVRLRRVDLPIRVVAHEEPLKCTFDW